MAVDIHLIINHILNIVEFPKTTRLFIYQNYTLRIFKYNEYSKSHERRTAVTNIYVQKRTKHIKDSYQRKGKSDD